MLLLIYFFVILLLSAVFHFPILKQELSEDDGNWFYISVFRKYGYSNLISKNNTFYKGDAFFNLQTIFQYIYLIFKTEDPYFSKKIKYYWYIITDIAIFCCSFLIWDNINMSFIISSIYILLISQPNSYSDLTYAEFFVALPFIITIALYFLGVNHHNVWLLFISGVFASLVYQFKAIYLFVLTLPLFYRYTAFIENLYFFSGFIFILLILPNYIILCFSDKKKEDIQFYLKSLFHYYVSFYYVIINHIFKSKQNNNSTGTSEYIEGKWNDHISIKDEILKFYIIFKFAFKHSIVFVLLSIISLAFVKDRIFLYILCLIPFNLLVIFMQKSYHQPKLGFFNLPIAILSGFLIYYSFENTSIVSKVMIIFLISFSTFNAIKTMLLKLKKENISYIANVTIGSQVMYNLCPVIGKYVKDRTNKNDYIYVYGNYPSIYLLSRRRSIIKSVFSFPNRKQNVKYFKDILKYMAKTNTPIYFIDINNVCYEAWKPQQAFDYMGVNYIVEKKFFVKNHNNDYFYMYPGLPYNFTAYRLDEYYFIQNNIERLRLSNQPLSIKLEQIDKLIQRYDNIADLHSLKDIFIQGNTSIKSSLTEQIEIEQLIKNEKYEVAQNLLNAQILNSKSNAATWLMLGEIAFVQGNQLRAEDLFKESFELNPYSIVLLNNLAVLTYMQGNIKLAKKYIDNTLQYCPTYQDALTNKEMIYG